MMKSFNRGAAPGSVRAAVFGAAALNTAALGIVALGTAALGIVASLAAGATATAEERSPLERRFLSEPVRVTAGMPRAGEGYFAPDARRICYQAVPEGYPFYQIFVQPFSAAAPAPAEPVRVSPGRGRTTCSWFAPDGGSLLFASSHLDPHMDATERAAREQAEEDRRTGRRRRYQWDFDPHTDIFLAPLDPATGRATGLRRLTSAPGYDAECSFSPDGRRILFVSDRDGDPDIYVMNVDGTELRQLTDSPGYDGGPFFSPDGRFVTYRTDRVEKDMLQIHVMRADGAGDLPLTSGSGVRWAPYWHPRKPWLIWTGADHSDPQARPNYDLWIARYDSGSGPDAGFRAGPPVRITDHAGADVLPVFSPDGSLLMWTASRDGDGGRGSSSQLWVSRLDEAAVEAALPPLPPPAAAAASPKAQLP